MSRRALLQTRWSDALGSGSVAVVLDLQDCFPFSVHLASGWICARKSHANLDVRLKTCSVWSALFLHIVILFVCCVHNCCFFILFGDFWKSGLNKDSFLILKTSKTNLALLEVMSPEWYYCCKVMLCLPLKKKKYSETASMYHLWLFPERNTDIALPMMNYTTGRCQESANWFSHHMEINDGNVEDRKITKKHSTAFFRT